jgi:polar amino acid transport system substrate-binding protein
MSIKTVIQRFGLAYIIALLTLITTTASAKTFEKQLALVGNIVPTLVDNEPKLSRANELVKRALSNYEVNITSTTQTWVGSGLRNGKYVGFVDHYSLNVQRAGYLYSNPYMVLPLHIASRSPKAQEANRLDTIYRTSLGVENRFANTDELRSERSVRWARSPDFLSNIQQLAGRRVDNIIADKFMLQAFNALLAKANHKPLYLSQDPIYNVELRLAIKNDTPNAQSIVDDFNASLITLKNSGELESITNPFIDPTGASGTPLDEALYQDVERRW